MCSKSHLSLWWSILCSSHGLSHFHFVLARSSAGALELVWVTKSQSCWILSLSRPNHSVHSSFWFMATAYFQTQKYISLPSVSVTFCTLQLSSGPRQRLAFSIHADTSETIGTRCQSPPFSVTMQRRPKTPKHSGNPGRSGPHVIVFKGLITGICYRLDSDRRGSKTKWQRDGDSSSGSVALPPRS